MNLNQELHEALGYCWHELVRNDVDIAKDVISAKVHVCKKCGYKTNDCQEECNPDYVAEPWLVIREMRQALTQIQWPDFRDSIGGIKGRFEFIRLDLILDTTGKLAQLALDWLQKEEL